MVATNTQTTMDKIRNQLHKIIPIIKPKNSDEENDASRPNSFILRSKSYRGSESSRKIYLNIPPNFNLNDNNSNNNNNKKKKGKDIFRSNKIVTTKYNLITFLPKNLFEQFRRVANLYFLGMVVLQLIPNFQVGNVVFVVLPLVTVIAITAIKDAVEDWKRWQADKRFNSTSVEILSNWINVNFYNENNQLNWYDPILYPINKLKSLFIGSSPPSLVESGSGLFKPTFEPGLWEDVKVGDIIRIKKDESIPADILLLSTSEPDGECYIETKNLDGETNLKPRNSLKETGNCRDPVDCTNLHAIIECGAPTSNLFVLNGSLIILEPPEIEQDFEQSRNNSIVDDFRMSSLVKRSSIPFNIKNILLRGCVLKNTSYAIGLVLFTGGDTKIILNSSPTPSKRSKIEKMMNKQVSLSFFILILLALTIAIGYGITVSKWKGTPVGLLFGILDDSLFYTAFINFWAALILLQNVIPVSLYVSIEFVKSWQAFFIFKDIEMYYKPTDSVCIPKSWNLSDDLGQIEYIFSDKTGTLTRNIMEFKKCSINGKIYGQTLPGEETDVEKGLSKRKSKRIQSPPMQEVKLKEERNSLIQNYFEMIYKVYEPKYVKLDPKKLTFVDPELYKDLLKDDEQSEAIKNFFLNLALCHTVLLEVDNQNNNNNNNEDNDNLSIKELVYRAESPDEKALVAAAKDLGFVFKSRQKDIFNIEILGEEFQFEQLALIEFDSTRKRMSVLVKRPKPWDDIVLFCKGADNVILERLAKKNDELVQTTQHHLTAFSNKGLRTFCLGYRIFTNEEFDNWYKKLRSAQTLVQTYEREEALNKVYDEVESELLLMGATAIEDKLQEQVPECIEALREAGIKVWVLTGDKMETAINIGFGCNLLSKDMKIWTIPGGTSNEVKENFEHVIKQLESNNNDDEYQLSIKEHALVIDGIALKFLLESRSTTSKLIELAPKFKSVICCRTSPLQKAQVVRLIKKGHKALTLAIGDGANDVSMIQEAHVGVAIAGEEGLQASMVSDYTLAQFRFLKNLMLVHGQNSYHRIAEMILCFFYKNIIWTLAAFWYQFYCGFSSNLFYDYSFIPLYNMIFTVAPVVILGTMDQRLTYEYLMKYPRVYKLGIQGKFFKHQLFWIYILDGFYQSIVCFFGFFFISDDDIYSSDGRSPTALELSTSIAIVIVVIANLFVGFHTRYWNWWVHFWIYISIIIVFLFTAIYSLLPGEYNLVGIHLFSKSITFWLALPLIIVTAMLPRFLYFYIKVTFFPDDLDLIRERKRLKKLEKKSMKSRV